MNTDEKAIAAVLAKYQDALNESDTDAVLKLYASDGVFMPQNSPSSVGAQAVRKAYDAVFDAIKLTVKFDIAEVRQLAPDWAFARTNWQEGLRSTQAAKPVRKAIRSCSYSRRSKAPGR